MDQLVGADQSESDTGDRPRCEFGAGALDPLVIDFPPCISEQGCDPPVAVTSVLSRQFDHVSNQQVFVRPSFGHVALRRSVLAEHAACTALGNTKLVANQINAQATTRGA